MYRVLFRVVKVCIHIKESLQLDVLFKKSQQVITCHDSYTLSNGVADVNCGTEFFLSKKDPTFQVHVNAKIKNIKKLVGYILLNLSDYKINGSYQEIRTLEKSPGSKALIEFDFIIFKTDISICGAKLVSVKDFETERTKNLQKEIQKNNVDLTERWESLKDQVNELQKAKNIHDKQCIQFQASKRKLSEDFSDFVGQIKKRMELSAASLQSEREKTKYLIQLINKQGYQNIIDQNIKDSFLQNNNFIQDFSFLTSAMPLSVREQQENQEFENAQKSANTE